MKNEKTLIDTAEMNMIIERLSFQILEKCPDFANTYIVGIKRRGVHIADRIVKSLEKHGKTAPKTGTLDITLYRDDLTQVAEMPKVHKSDMGFDVNGKNIIIVDDVLFTGRTIRAALDAVLDYGRPSRIMLAVMVDRGHKELPIHADFTGKHIPTGKDEVIHVKVTEIDGTQDCVTISKRA